MLNSRLADEEEKRQLWFNKAIGRFFDLPVMLLFGAALPWGGWLNLGWKALALIVALLLLRRVPAWMALHRLLPWTQHLFEAVFAGWFGPISVAAVFYATDLQDKVNLPTLWPIISLATAGSVLVHGITSTSFTVWLGHRLDRAAKRSAPNEEATGNLSKWT